jgi:hypothetical protein
MSSRFCAMDRIGRSTLAVICILGSLGTEVLAQAAFDPYYAGTGAYLDYTSPAYPTNLALPGRARQALNYERQAIFGNRASDTPWDRFVTDGYDDLFSNPRFGSSSDRDFSRAGVPYYFSSNKNRDSYVPNRKADREFNAVQKERERRYFEAIREKDPVKRARLLRRVNDPIDPATLVLDDKGDTTSGKDSTQDGRDSLRSGAVRGVARNPDPSDLRPSRETSVAAGPRPSFRMPMADESLDRLPPSRVLPLKTPRMETIPPTISPETAPPSSATLPPVLPPGRSSLTPRTPTPPARRRLSVGAERRPSLPSDSSSDRSRIRPGSSSSTSPGSEPGAGRPR